MTDGVKSQPEDGQRAVTKKTSFSEMGKSGVINNDDVTKTNTGQ